MIPVTGEVAMVNPNLVCSLDTNVIPRSKNLSNLDVANNNIILVENAKTNTRESWGWVSSMSHKTEQ